MNNLRTKSTVISFLIVLTTWGQGKKIPLAEPCFYGLQAGANPGKSASIITLNGDVLEWNNGVWDGQLRRANITMPPPHEGYCLNPIRAVWIGNGQSWNLNGEGFSLKLAEPLKAFETYTFIFTYTSDGSGSDSAFAPEISTSLYGDVIGYYCGHLRPAGKGWWRTDSITFTAAYNQNGDQWITFHTRREGSSGMVVASCEQPRLEIRHDQPFCEGLQVKLSTRPGFPDLFWSTGETAPEITVTGGGEIVVSKETGCGTAYDTLNIEFKNCGAGVGLPTPKGKGGGLNIKWPKWSFDFCWTGSCDDDDIATGPPSPPIVVYNIVTPNGDGYNDFFVAENAEQGRWKLRVYNRWGVMVFEDMEYKNTWSPVDLPAGVYYVVLKDRNSPFKYTGTLSVIQEF